MSISESFNKSFNKPDERFNIVYFKRLLLNFIVSNNISFKVITTLSFEKLLNYLK
jgi:hypothetical protein